ncbi:unnamed protein product [Vitrella brassicaformis CCMP3155]|uniref:Uncharacterized protein n=1 Tax=Vitrella brassicaformis (strain CCMP3155) TaxID=1169540 RepID=A0A0G4F2W3_VITBC|nr:unnamed protein product [Vitrella brassicaformis CCMP3155]|eukprot:CEM05740.1 unnamed protein product [Vitrella brassicaformis CCMP3155]
MVVDGQLLDVDRLDDWGRNHHLLSMSSSLYKLEGTPDLPYVGRFSNNSLISFASLYQKTQTTDTNHPTASISSLLSVTGLDMGILSSAERQRVTGNVLCLVAMVRVIRRRGNWKEWSSFAVSYALGVASSPECGCELLRKGVRARLPTRRHHCAAEFGAGGQMGICWFSQRLWPIDYGDLLPQLKQQKAMQFVWPFFVLRQFANVKAIVGPADFSSISDAERAPLAYIAWLLDDGDGQDALGTGSEGRQMRADYLKLLCTRAIIMAALTSSRTGCYVKVIRSTRSRLRRGGRKILASISSREQGDEREEHLLHQEYIMCLIVERQEKIKIDWVVPHTFYLLGRVHSSSDTVSWQKESVCHRTSVVEGSARGFDRPR